MENKPAFSDAPEKGIRGKFFIRLWASRLVYLFFLAAAWGALFLVALSAGTFVMEYIPFMYIGLVNFLLLVGVTFLLLWLWLLAAGWRSKFPKLFGYEYVLKEKRVIKLGPLHWTARSRDIGLSKPSYLTVLILAGQLLALALFSFLVQNTVAKAWHGRAMELKGELQGNGYPVSLSEFQRQVPPAQNGFPVLYKLFNEDVEEKLGGSDVRIPIARLDPEALAYEKKAIAPFESYYKKELAPFFDKYRLFQSVDYYAASRDPWNYSVQKKPRYGSLNQFLERAAVVNASKWDPGEAWKYVRAQISFLRLIFQEDDYSLYSMLAKYHIERIAQTSINIMLNRPGAVIPPDIQGFLKTLFAKNLFAKTLKSFIADTFDSEAQKEITERGYYSILPGKYLPDVASYMMDIFTINQVEILLRLRKLEGWKDALERDREIENKIRFLPEWPYLFAKIGIPRYVNLYEHELEAKTWLKLALIHSALESYRGKYKKYPGKLLELAPGYVGIELLNDYYTDRQFDYGTGVETVVSTPGVNGNGRDSEGNDFRIVLTSSVITPPKPAARASVPSARPAKPAAWKKPAPNKAVKAPAKPPKP